MKRFVRRGLKIFLFLCVIIIVLAMLLLRPLQDAPTLDEIVWSEWTKRVQPKDSASLKVGWSEASLLGKQQVSLAGYGPRDTWQQILDTPKVKVFALEQDELKILIFNIDLLIFPPELAHRLEQHYQQEYKLYFTASHTHNGMGGWLKGAAAYFLAGNYDEQLMQHLEKQAQIAAEAAISKTKHVNVRFLKTAAPAQARHRLESEAYKDVYLRILIFETAQQRAVLVSYAAHNTTLKSRSPLLSNDYAAILEQKLRKEFDFVAFAAGAVGSHGPKTYDTQTHLEGRRQVGEALADSIMANLAKAESLDNSQGLAYLKQPLSIACAPRVLADWQLRPQVFNLLLQEPEPYIQALQIGNILLMAMPCDFSGELIPDIETALQPKQELFITSFNGAYIGYVTHDRHYDLHKSEVREMNWGGRGLGNYFTQVVRQIITKTK